MAQQSRSDAWPERYIQAVAEIRRANYDGVAIWDPEPGKTFKSKMTLKGNELDVKGCVGPICSG